MPFSIEVDQQHHLVLVKVWGVFDSSGFKDGLIALNGMGPFDESYRLLEVFHELVQIEIPAHELRTVANRRSGAQWPENASLHPQAIRVVVAPADLAFGVNRLYDAEVNSSGVQFTVVRNVTEAAALLGMDAADIDMTFAA